MNGLPIYAKGSNAIPMDVVPSRGRAPDALRRLVRDAASANQNMLRVWGGTQLSLNLAWKDFAVAVTYCGHETRNSLHASFCAVRLHATHDQSPNESQYSVGPPALAPSLCLCSVLLCGGRSRVSVS